MKHAQFTHTALTLVVAGLCMAGFSTYTQAQTAAAPAKSATAKLAKPAAAKKDVDLGYESEISAWRERADTSLRRDNGWLTLAGRYVMREGMNTIGTGADNDIVLAPGLGPEKLGTVTIGVDTVVLTLNPGISMNVQTKDGPKQFSGERVLTADPENREWVSLDRLSFHVITRQHEGKPRFVLRVADNKNPLRANFAGRVWYDIDPDLRLNAQFVPYKTGNKAGKKINIINVLDEVSEENAAGYVQFKLNGKTYRFDALGDEKDKELFIIMKDVTAGEATYGAGRFLTVQWPQEVRQKGGPVVLDFNKAYNPPCAFSKFTTCPMPPKQNQLPIAVPAGEKYRDPLTKPVPKQTAQLNQASPDPQAQTSKITHASQPGAPCPCPQHQGLLSFSKLGNMH